MRISAFTATGAAFLLLGTAQAAPLSYFLAGGDYSEEIPAPETVLGYEVGEWHVRHDQLVEYLKTLAESSDRVTLEEIGRTYEQRPLLMLAISSPENLAKLEEIQRNHSAWALSQEDSPQSAEDLPLIVNMGYGVHGDESSASNASLVTAWHLAASTEPSVSEFLDHTVVLLDPCLNPDGFARFAQWANMHRGKHPVADSVAREHNAVWPGGRTNHYWFDLNRDWLLAQHPESKARLRQFRLWLPNIVTDFHEMGSDTTFFFQPGVARRKHPLTPAKNVEFTKRIAKYHADVLNRIGSLYFNEERFDDFYYGKGSTYPDAHGSIGILFEQASSRGHRRESIHGDFDFAFTIRNQVRTSLSTLKAAGELRTELLEYQREFFRSSQTLGEADPVQYYVFGDPQNPTGTWHMVDILWRHGIEIQELGRELDGYPFQIGSGFVVAAGQPQYRLIKALFERRTTFEDNIFYDVSAWNLPLAAGIRCGEFGELPEGAVGKRIDAPTFPAVSAPTEEEGYAYVFEWSGYYAPRALNRLHKAKVRAKVSMVPFTAETASGPVKLSRGTIVVPMGIQDKAKPGGIYEAIKTIAERDGVKVHRVVSGLTPEGVDLGSPSIKPLKPPRPLLVTGNGVNAYEAGEVWHLLDYRFDVPVALIERDELTKMDLDAYTHIVMVGGRHSIVQHEAEALKRWISKGGILIAIKSGAQWVKANGLASLEFVQGYEENPDSGKEGEEGEEGAAEDKKAGKAPARPVQRMPYANYAMDRDSQRTSGAIFRGKIDTTHPLGFGFTSDEIALFRNSNLVMKASQDPYATVAVYRSPSLLAGYVHPDVGQAIDGSAAIVAEKQGKGAVITMVDNPNFRAYWFGTNRLFLNALFFGGVLEKTGDPAKPGSPPRETH